jgi:hypothetical protein
MYSEPISDFMKIYSGVSENKRFRNINHKKLDTLLVGESEVYASKGDVVIQAIYNAVRGESFPSFNYVFILKTILKYSLNTK